jgi:hypothetical protein
MFVDNRRYKKGLAFSCIIDRASINRLCDVCIESTLLRIIQLHAHASNLCKLSCGRPVGPVANQFALPRQFDANLCTFYSSPTSTTITIVTYI